MNPEATIVIYCGLGLNKKGEQDSGLDEYLDDVGEVWYVATR